MAPVPTPPITLETLNALRLAIASGVKVVRFQDRTVEYASVDEMIKASNYIYQLLYPGGVVPGGYRQIRMYTHKGL